MADIEQLARDTALFRQEFGEFSGAMSERMNEFNRHLDQVHGEVREISDRMFKSDIERAEQRGAIRAKAGISKHWRQWLTPIIALIALALAIYDRLRVAVDKLVH